MTGGPSGAEPAAPRRGTVAVLALIAATGSMAIHMLVPALPRIAAEFATGEARAQQAVSFYLAGLAGGQLIAGPLIDRLGRRPLMLAGLLLYIAGGMAAALAPQIDLLLAARVVQACGGAFGVVSARVMVGDLFGPHRAPGVQATLMAIVLVSPAFAPVIGGAIADVAGWRAIFGLLGIAGIAGLASFHRLPETRPALAAPTAQPVARAVPANGPANGPAAGESLVRSYLRLLGNRGFLLTAATLGAASSGLYMFLGAAPFLLAHRYGLGAGESGVALLVVALGGIAGTRLVMPVQKRGDGMIVGTGAAATGSACALALALSGTSSLAAFVGPFILLGIGAGLAGPVAFNHVAFAERGLAATATSLAGAMQMLASSIALGLLGFLAPVTPLRLALAVTAATALALMCALSRRATACAV